MKGIKIMKWFIGLFFSMVLFVTSAFAGNNANEALQAAARYMAEGNMAKAVELLQPLAETGNPAILHNLGMIYAKGGTGVPADYPRAFSYYKRAAMESFLPSIHNMGVMYQLGQSVEQNYTRALSYYNMTAEFAYAPAFNSLAFIYANGLGVKRDNVRAYSFLLIAEQLGSQNAKQSVSRFRSSLAQDEINQAGVLAQKFWNSMIINVKNCAREISKRNNKPFDESAPPPSNLLVGCGIDTSTFN
jgi:TPR repeat protein